MARLAGILNCYLHWPEMLSYKEKGFRVNDLGGIAPGANPDAMGVDRFKVAFGSQAVIEHNRLCTRSLSWGTHSCGFVPPAIIVEAADLR
jgi:hypothetical protein